MDYAVNSQGTTISPSLAPSLFGNFVGGMLSCQNENYLVTDISASTEADEGPIFTIQKNVRGNASDPGSTGAFLTVQKYVAPDLSLSNAQVMFMAVENMADPNSWGTPNPLTKVIAIGDSLVDGPSGNMHAGRRDIVCHTARRVGHRYRDAHTYTRSIRCIQDRF